MHMDDLLLDALPVLGGGPHGIHEEHEAKEREVEDAREGIARRPHAA